MWPTRRHEWLRGAGLYEAHDALADFERWQASLESETELDPASIRLLPLVHTNLRQQAVDHPLLPLLEHFYQTVRRENQELFEEMAGVLARLAAADIPTLLLKGAPLATLYYRDLGARAMADFVVAVPTSHAIAATGELERAGFRPVRQIERAFLRFRHSLDFHGPRSHSLDLPLAPAL